MRGRTHGVVDEPIGVGIECGVFSSHPEKDPLPTIRKQLGPRKGTVMQFAKSRSSSTVNSTVSLVISGVSPGIIIMNRPTVCKPALRAFSTPTHLVCGDLLVDIAQQQIDADSMPMSTCRHPPLYMSSHVCWSKGPHGSRSTIGSVCRVPGHQLLAEGLQIFFDQGKDGIDKTDLLYPIPIHQIFIFIDDFDGVTAPIHLSASVNQ